MFAQYHTLNLLYSTMVHWYSENKQSQTNSDIVIDFYTNIFTINNMKQIHNVICLLPSFSMWTRDDRMLSIA